MDLGAQIDKSIAELIRPLVEADGGTIELVSAEDNVVVVRMGSLCAGCSGQHFTRTYVLEPVLRRIVGSNLVLRIEQGA